MTTTRTATGVALHSSSLIPSGGNGFDMLARCLSLNRRCYNLTLPICAVTNTGLGIEAVGGAFEATDGHFDVSIEDNTIMGNSNPGGAAGIAVLGGFASSNGNRVTAD